MLSIERTDLFDVVEYGTIWGNPSQDYFSFTIDLIAASRILMWLHMVKHTLSECSNWLRT